MHLKSSPLRIALHHPPAERVSAKARGTAFSLKPTPLCPARPLLQAPGPTNGVLASVPRHPLFRSVMEEMARRVAENATRNVLELTGALGAGRQPFACANTALHSYSKAVWAPLPAGTAAAATWRERWPPARAWLPRSGLLTGTPQPGRRAMATRACAPPAAASSAVKKKPSWD